MYSRRRRYQEQTQMVTNWISAMTEEEKKRYLLTVPYKYRQRVKQFKAQWNPVHRTWYSPIHNTEENRLWLTTNFFLVYNKEE